ncbi:MAG: ABC transporter permease [Spirochaetales bacterium]|nr:ABC transporter permease [Spirochaetales bacterium]MCF7937764.1 ABC transporter permease [Spirochaetales bacterium]
MLSRKPPTSLFGSLIALAAAFLVAMLILGISGGGAGRLSTFFIGPFSNLFSFGNMLSNAGLLSLTGLGISLAFRSGTFNLGGEGQVYLGALAGYLVCILLPSTAGSGGALLALTAAGGGGLVLAAFSGFARMRWGTDELISSFLLSAAAIPLVDFLITGPLKDSNSYLITTQRVAEGFFLPRLLEPSNLSLELPIGILLAAAATFLLFRTRPGYELRITGLNRDFARYGGVATGLYTVIPMAAGGFFHGMAGGLALLGTHHALIKGFSSGLGWNGIAVALIAGNHPAMVVPAALVFAYLQAASKAAMLHANVGFELNAIIQAAVFFLITIRFLPGRGSTK